MHADETLQAAGPLGWDHEGYSDWSGKAVGSYAQLSPRAEEAVSPAATACTLAELGGDDEVVGAMPYASALPKYV